MTPDPVSALMALHENAVDARMRLRSGGTIEDAKGADAALRAAIEEAVGMPKDPPPGLLIRPQARGAQCIQAAYVLIPPKSGAQQP